MWIAQDCTDARIIQEYIGCLLWHYVQTHPPPENVGSMKLLSSNMAILWLTAQD